MAARTVKRIELTRQTVKEHEFTVILAGISQITEEAANALYVAGCDDGSPGSCDGLVSVDFHRDAPSLEEAIRSAIADIRNAGFQVDRIEISGLIARLHTNTVSQRRWPEYNNAILLEIYKGGCDARAQVEDQVEYPESDGKPMGETDLHRDWMIRILEILRYRYRGQRVYVASNLLVYYEEGLPRKFVVPDDFVVLDCDPHRRRVFKTWEEGRVPDVVFEVTSRGTRSDDESFKPQIYERLGVQEYFLYDPSSEYLRPALQGFRPTGQEGFVTIVPNPNGKLTSETLEVVLRLDNGELVMSDLRTGKALTTEAEAERAAKEMERAAKKWNEQQKKRNERQKKWNEQPGKPPKHESRNYKLNWIGSDAARIPK